MKQISTLAILPLLLSSCSFLPMGTDMWISRKLDNTPLGSSRLQVQQSFGNPIYRIKFPQGTGAIEIWGYDIGNYWYHESLNLFFKEDRFIALPRTPYDIFALMHQLGLVEPRTEFLNSLERESA